MGLALTRAAVKLTFAFDASTCRSTVLTEMSSGETVVASPTGLENLLSSSHAGDCDYSLLTGDSAGNSNTAA